MNYGSNDLPYGIYESTHYIVKLTCIKVQLTCAVGMFITNVIYLIVFAIVTIKTRTNHDDLIVPIHSSIYPMNITQSAVRQHQPNKPSSFSRPVGT
jgi:hypothetical protein